MANYSKKRAATKGLPLNRPETHAWNAFFDKDGKPYQNIKGYEERPGGGPLIKSKYINRAGKLGSKAKADEFVMKQITQDPNAVFSLTGGFYPTFSNKAGTGFIDWYSASNAGFVSVAESFNSSGPGRMKLRGNHVWYQSAADYVPTVQKLYTADTDQDGNPDMMDPNVSILEDIFLAYMNWVKQGNTTDRMMQTWRESFASNLKDIAEKEYLQKEGMIDPSTHTVESTGSENILKGEISEAPEELIPKVLKAKFPDIFESLDEISVAMEGTKGNSMDIAFNFMGQAYIKEVTQERLTESTSHTSVLNKFKLTADTLKDIGDRNFDSLRNDLLGHFSEQRTALNEVLEFIQNQHSQQNSDKTLRQFAQEDLGMKWRMNSDAIKDLIKQGNTPKSWKDTFAMEKRVAKTGEKKFVAGALSRAITSVMHILATDWDKVNEFSDLFVLSDDVPINVGYDWKVNNNKGMLTLAKTSLSGVIVNPDSQFYMDAFLTMFINEKGSELNFGEEQKAIVIRLTNMLWLAHAGQTENLEMVTALIQQQGMMQSGSGILVAGGAIVYEDEQVNKAIGTFLTGLMEKSDQELKNHPQIKKAMDEAKLESNSFRRTLESIDETISIETQQINPNDPIKAAAMAEMTSQSEVWTKMNQDLKASSWAAPYLGLNYQGGMRSGIWPLMSPTLKD